MRTNSLQLLDNLVARGQLTFSTAEAAQLLGSSTAATSNVLSRLASHGLVDRVARGHYAVRPIGRLGTAAAAEDVALAVGAVFGHRSHRIGYRSALAHHDLIVHPARVIQVACPEQVRVSGLSGRPLRVVMESEDTIDVGAIDLDHGAHVSCVERALLDAARRIDLAGGIDVVAEALATASRELDVELIRDHAMAIDGEPALRRLASIARVRNLGQLSVELAADLGAMRTLLDADPRDTDEVAWQDDRAGVRWSRAALDSSRQ